MKKSIIWILIGLFIIPLAGCQAGREKEQIGTVMGGALGGVLGSNVGKGQGKTAAIIAGTLLGVVIGSEIGRYMDRTDEMQAQRALEYNRDRQPSSWHNPNTGASFTTMPTTTYQNGYGQNCREYQTDIYVDGKSEAGRGTACRQPDGTWRIMN